MAETLLIYMRLYHARGRAQAAYRLSAAMHMAGMALITAADTVAIAFIYRQAPAFAGWTFQETAFLCGTAVLSERMGDLIAGQVERLGTYIRTGELDAFLARPLSALGQVLSSELPIRQFGGVVQGGLVLAYAGQWVDWTPGRVAMTVSIIVTGTAIFCGVWIATNSIAFWLVDAKEVSNAFTYGGAFFAQYPQHIFSGWLRRMMTFLVPMGFVNYFPALYVLDKPGPSWARFGSPVVALLTLAVARTIWRGGLRHYRSTGS